MMLRVPVIVLMVLGLISMQACSSPLDEDEPDATATAPASRASPTPVTVADAGTGTSTDAMTSEPDDDGSGEAPEGEPTTTSTRTRRTASATAASPSPTGEPLPDDGGALRVAGQAVTGIIPGGDNGRTLYALTEGRIWRTNDGGRTWSAAGEGEFGPLVVALNEPDVLYAGDRGTCGRGFSYFPFQRSTDAGRSWETVEANADIQPLLAYEAQGAAYLYGTNCGLAVSADGGDTWRRVVEMNGEDVFSVVTQRSDPMEQLLVVAATEGGTGRLFQVDLAGPGEPLFVGALTQFWGAAAVDWVDGRIVVAHAHQVGVSDDGGETWSWTRDGLEDATIAEDPLFEGIPEGVSEPMPGFGVARIDPTNRDRIWIGGSRGAFLSVDGGASWQLVGDAEPVTGIAISAVSGRAFVSYASGTRLWSLAGPEG